MRGRSILLPVGPFDTDVLLWIVGPCLLTMEYIGCQIIEDIDSRTLSKAATGLGMILTLLPARLPMERL